MSGVGVAVGRVTVVDVGGFENEGGIVGVKRVC